MSATPYSTPFSLIEGDLRLGLVLLADHAGRALPDEYHSLSLPPQEFDRHIAYDIGVEALTRRLAELTGAPAIMANFSRLLIDANRGEDDPTLIRQLYDGTVISGNYPLDETERQRRIDHFYAPYHGAVDRLITEVSAAGGAAPLLLSIHSFTPHLGPRPRPWQVGVLWDTDPRAAVPLIEMLRAQDNLTVGDNEPYDGALKGDTMYRHAITPGFAHALIEVRQDLLADAAGIEDWALRLAPIAQRLNALPDIHEARQFGSRAD